MQNKRYDVYLPFNSECTRYIDMIEDIKNEFHMSATAVIKDILKYYYEEYYIPVKSARAPRSASRAERGADLPSQSEVNSSLSFLVKDAKYKMAILNLLLSKINHIIKFTSFIPNTSSDDDFNNALSDNEILIDIKDAIFNEKI